MDLENLQSINSDAIYNILASSVDGFALVSSNGHIFDTNQSYCQMLGYTRGELLKMHMSDVDAFETPEDVARRSEEIIQKGSLRFETKQCHKSGSLIDVEVTVNHTHLHGGLFFSIFKDITSQKSMEDACRIRDEHYKNIVESQSEFVDRYLPGGILTYVNPALARLAGFEANDLLGKSFYNFIHEDDREESVRLIESINTENPRVDVEGRIVLPDGTTHWTHWTQMGVFDEKGNILEYQSVGRDVTDQKVAEFRLLESEQKYRLIFECAGDSISVMDLHGKILAVNPVSYTMLGYTQDELIKLPADKIDARPDEMAANAMKLMEAGYYSGETEFIRKDGSLVPITVEARKIVWEGQPAILSVCRDITEQKKYLKSLDYINKCFNQALNGSLHILYRHDVKTGYDYLSPSFENVTGYQIADFMKTTLEQLAEYIHPDDATHVFALFDEACRTRTGSEAQIGLEYRFKKADGSFFWLYDSTTACFNDNDELVSLYGSAYDITERKKAEKERLEFEKQLLHTQKLESLGIMAGGIAHDFNNSLQSMLANMELAELTLDAESGSQKYISNAIKSAKRAAHLTSLMLTYSGKGFVNKKELNLNNVIREETELLKTAASASVAIKYSLFAELPYINANDSQIQQIVMNLITNGAESIDKPQGCVTISTGVQNCDQEYLSTSLMKEKAEPGSYVYCEVKDNGCGMSKETLTRLFDPFFTTKFTGRGLGLSAVMGIIKYHHGALIIESVLGKGSTFRALFPVSESVAPAKVKEPDVSPDQKPIARDNAISGTVLVVDDDKAVLKTCSKMFEFMGFKVLTAIDGLDAVTKFREYRDEIDLVLMDLTMPNMDGLTAMAEIYNISPDIKVILASGFSQEGLRKRITGKAPSGFIQKPYSMSVLGAELQRIMVAESEPLKA